MADLVPVSFPAPPEPAIVSYNYNDFAEGTGIVVNYLYAVGDASAATYRISTAIPWSRELVIGATGAPTAATVTFTFYSGIINTTRTIYGTALFNFCMGMISLNAGATMSVQLKLYHYNSTGPTSTQIGSTWTSQTATTIDAQPYTEICGAEMPITTPKTFNPGDQIKLEVIITYNKNATSLSEVEVGISPQNLDGVAIIPSTNAKATTVFTASIPFRIDR